MLICFAFLGPAPYLAPFIQPSFHTVCLALVAQGFGCAAVLGKVSLNYLTIIFSTHLFLLIWKNIGSFDIYINFKRITMQNKKWYLFITEITGELVWYNTFVKHRGIIIRLHGGHLPGYCMKSTSFYNLSVSWTLFSDGNSLNTWHSNFSVSDKIESTQL